MKESRVEDLIAKLYEMIEEARVYSAEATETRFLTCWTRSRVIFPASCRWQRR